MEFEVIKDAEKTVKKFGKNKVLVIGAGVAALFGLAALARNRKNKQEEEKNTSIPMFDDYPYKVSGTLGGVGSEADLFQMMDILNLGIEQQQIILENAMGTVASQQAAILSTVAAQQDAALSRFEQTQLTSIGQLADLSLSNNQDLINAISMLQTAAPVSVAPVPSGPSAAAVVIPETPSQVNKNNKIMVQVALMPAPTAVTSYPETSDNEEIYGSGGVDYDTLSDAGKKAMEENTEALKSDDSYRQSEIERAERVISSRTDAGLDISDQQEYLSSLKGMG